MHFRGCIYELQYRTVYEQIEVEFLREFADTSVKSANNFPTTIDVANEDLGVDHPVPHQYEVVIVKKKLM